MNGEVTGIDEFRDFRDTLEDVHARVPSDVVKAGLEDTIDELKEEIVKNIRRASTDKGGTFDSRTSPYGPGGTNDSSSDGLHMADKSSWNSYHQNNNPHMFVIQPDKQMVDRAFWMEEGTADHGPRGDTPMYFYVAGQLIVMADKPDRSSPFYGPYIQQAATDDVGGAQFNFGEPTEVDGVEAQHFMRDAVRTIIRRKSMSRNIGRRWRKVLQEEGFEA